MEDNEYSTGLKDFVQKSFEVPVALKKNNFGQKYKDYSSTLKNDKEGKADEKTEEE